PFHDPADLAVRDAQPLGDLDVIVPLHAQLQDVALLRLQLGQEVLQLVDERGGLLRRRLAGQQLQQQLLRVLALRRLLGGVALGALVKAIWRKVLWTVIRASSLQTSSGSSRWNCPCLARWKKVRKTDWTMSSGSMRLARRWLMRLRARITSCSA